VFEELAGLVRVNIQRDAAGGISATRVGAPLPLSLGQTVAPETVAACAGLAPEDIVTKSHRPVVASVGAGFVIAEVTDAAVLARAAPDLAAFRQAADAYPGMQLRFSLHLYARLGAGRYRARMFGPLGGVLEDPATGSANAALAALLRSLSPGDAPARYEIEQGIEMGRPSLILAEGWRRGDDVMAAVAGACVDVTRGVLEV
jgi:trans-2,3-dihydro-3-hydroxyanthranilate isomerase